VVEDLWFTLTLNPWEVREDASEGEGIVRRGFFLSTRRWCCRSDLDRGAERSWESSSAECSFSLSRYGTTPWEPYSGLGFKSRRGGGDGYSRVGTLPEPFGGPADSLFEADARAPAQLALRLGRVVTDVMSEDGDAGTLGP
jgi:hypothetical protein